TYVELIDKTHYLNHYYFVSIIAFMMALLPAHRAFSLDVRRKPKLRLQQIPAWMILVLQVQLAIVYFYAGLAKLHPDWLFHAMPLRIWLPPLADMPLIGWLFPYKETAFAFSWFGVLYDLTIPFLLWWNRTRPLAYIAVVAFHVMTWIMFPIGMFPWIMMLSTLIFFSEAFHERILNVMGKLLRKFSVRSPFSPTREERRRQNPWLFRLFLFHIVLQLLIPWRFLLYPGKLFWHEQGFRFSWRVMLMEKNGSAFFTVRDPDTQREWDPTLSEFLTPRQEKMMATQPDMILQTAHLLRDTYAPVCKCEPEVYAQVYVSLNGRRNRPFIDPKVDLASIEPGWEARYWVLPYPFGPSPQTHD
ncbi:MAG: HTTM domain-containing protein, partial [Bacteroidota bacterium]